MSRRHLDIEPRAEELLVDQVISGLDQHQQAELDALLAGEAEKLQEELMRTAALVQLGMLQIENGAAQRMPDQLRSAILTSAPLSLLKSPAKSPAKNKAKADNVIDLADAAEKRSHRVAETRRTDFGRYAGWAAAAAMAIALVIFRADVDTQSPAADRGQLLASAPDLITAPWAVSDQPGYENVRGDVVWSDSAQNGYMRLAGLPANNPAEQQYQLWIVDPERSAEPVDGGVFDIPAGSGEFIVPIQAKLGVDKPVAFAITLEKRGGVVVSAGPLLVVAPVGS
jgi:anti-sigma-K factor RskA